MEKEKGEVLLEVADRAGMTMHLPCFTIMGHLLLQMTESGP